MENRFPSPVGSMSPQTAILVGRLRDGKQGDVVTDDELSDIVGMPIGQRYWRRVRTASQSVVRRYGLVWKRIRGTGALRCLNDDEVVDEVEASSVGKQRKASRAAARMLATVQVSQLTGGREKKLVALQRLMALHYDLTLSRTRATIMKEPESWKPDIAKVLRLGKELR